MFNVESLNVVCIGLPAARFNSPAAIDGNRDHAEKYESAVRRYETDQDDEALWENLRALCFENDEIQWHIDNPGRRMCQGFYV